MSLYFPLYPFLDTRVVTNSVECLLDGTNKTNEKTLYYFNIT